MSSATLPAILLALASVAGAQSTNPNPLAASRVFVFDQMTAITASSGAVGRKVFTARWPAAKP